MVAYDSFLSLEAACLWHLDLKAADEESEIPHPRLANGWTKEDRSAQGRRTRWKFPKMGVTPMV